MESLRLEDGHLTLDPDSVTCAGCGKTIGEDEAQAVRWGYWSRGVDDLYPFCLESAESKVEVNLTVVPTNSTFAV